MLFWFYADRIAVAVSYFTINTDYMSHPISLEVVGGSLDTLISSRPEGTKGGFVVFTGPRDLDYVQFSLEPTGLMLNWPTFQEGGKERLDGYVQVLKMHGFTEFTKTNANDGDAEKPDFKIIEQLKLREYTILEDGLYANCGRDRLQNTRLVQALFREVFQVNKLAGVQVETDPGW